MENISIIHKTQLIRESSGSPEKIPASSKKQDSTQAVATQSLSQDCPLKQLSFKIMHSQHSCWRRTQPPKIQKERNLALGAGPERFSLPRPSLCSDLFQPKRSEHRTRHKILARPPQRNMTQISKPATFFPSTQLTHTAGSSSGPSALMLVVILLPHFSKSPPARTCEIPLNT